MFPMSPSTHNLLSPSISIVEVWYSIHINFLAIYTSYYLCSQTSSSLTTNHVYFLSSMFNFSLHYPEVHITRPLAFRAILCVAQFFFSIPKPVHNNTWYKRYSCSCCSGANINSNSFFFTFNVYFYYLDLDLTSTLGFRLHI